MDILYLLRQTVCGGLAAAGFGVLFNVGFRALPWCMASGALALMVRTAARESDWSLVAASFVAALAVGAAVQLLHSRIIISRNSLEVVGCIPLIPGATATKAILGLFAVAGLHPAIAQESFIMAMEDALRVVFVIGALGTGLAIPTLLLRMHRTR